MPKRSSPSQKNKSHHRFVAFLRAVNVGGRTVKTPQLIDAFTRSGCVNVATFLASGNVIFDLDSKPDPELNLALEKTLAECVGFVSEVFLRSIEEVSQIGVLNPFQLNQSEQKAYTTHVGMVHEPASKKFREQVMALRSDYDDFVFDGTEFYWLCRGDKISASPLFEKNLLGKAIPVIHTMRNQRTMKRISDKFAVES